MPAGAGSIGTDALLAHQDFVLALARSLLRDEHAALDVVQETWVAALTGPPRSFVSLRAWLAQVARSRAGDRLRREARRAEQERVVARSAVDESGRELRERLALQHQVVAAVLALREPYRTTILRHYYEGLSAAEIARQDGVPAGTVRARISRAHDELRERLDTEFGGARTAWTAALGAFLEAARSPRFVAKISATKACIAGASIVAAVTVPVIAWVAVSRPAAPVLAKAPTTLSVPPSRITGPDLDPTSTAPQRSSLVAAMSLTGAGMAEELVDAHVSSQKTPNGKSDPSGIDNGGFEAKVGQDGAIPGWNIIVGARNGAEEPLAVAKVDTKEKRAGRASLLLSGDDTTRAWRAAQQTSDARPGGAYHLSAWAKTKDVKGEVVKGTTIHQFQNCFVALLFYDDNGEVVANESRKADIPTAGWHELTIDLQAPETARSAMVSVSLTMSGSLWIDEVSLTVAGGHDLPPKEVLVDEGFEKVTGLPAGWEETVGAKNGNGQTRSQIAVDRGSGANGSHASLRFSGDRNTIQWMGLERRFDAVPGDSFTMHAQVRAEKVHKEGVQFANLHIRVMFFDAEGKALGAAKYGQPGDGTYDWKDVSASGVAPEGTVKALAGIFLSMSGDAWFDDLRIEKRTGGKPAYEGWLTLETAHLVLRYPKDHPRAAEMKKFGERLDRAYEDVVKSLAVDYTDRITMFLYRDEQQGKNLTGRDLDFANPEGRAVHQRTNSTLSHEMVHCVALKLGTAQTGLLGEGIAVWLNGDSPDSHHDRAAKLLAKDDLPPMKALLETFRAQSNGYPAAGSFCGYLIETYGLAKFKQLYPMTDPAAASEAVLGKSFDAVDEDWRAFLKRRG